MTVRAALTFSLLLVAALSCGQYAALRERLEGKTPTQVYEIISASPVANDPEINYLLKDEALSEDEWIEQVSAIIDLRAMVEVPARAEPSRQEIISIKSSALYRDPGVQETSNWLSRALERLKNIRFELPKMSSTPNLGFLAGLGPILYYLMWFLIFLAISFLLFLAVKHINWRKRLTRKASALLEADEPERTLDEWLLQADDLEAQGRYREAVRALYLACLLRFDEALVARFDRGQTNWEHLARIEASPRKPARIDFRSPTQLFDRVWYGKIVRGREDVEQFRAWYVGVTDELRRKAA
jgi:hypothetical protein